MRVEQRNGTRREEPVVYHRSADTIIGPLHPERVVVEAWCGNQRPWRAKAYRGGVYAGVSGGCRSPIAAMKCGIAVWRSARKA